MKYKRIATVLWLILLANVIVAITKVFFGYLLKINSLTADGFHAITDSTSNIIGLIGIKLASKPADADHPYGHHKFETIAGFIIGFMLLLITYKIINNAIQWFISPTSPSISTLGLIALIITLIINIMVAIYEYRQGIKLDSVVLISDSIHTKSDIFISLGVLLTIILIKLGFPIIIDPIVSLVIAVFVFNSCLEIFKTSIGILVDKKALDENKINEIVLGVDKDILNVHKIRSRGRTDNVYIDLHIITDPNKTVKDAHDLTHRVELRLRETFNRNVELNAHIEPNER